MKPIHKIQDYAVRYPFRTIMIFAVIVRLISVLFSQGYGMHDDHFLVVEAPFSWTEGKDYANWMPWSQGSNPVPSGHSLLYPGINYLLFIGFKLIGLTNPKTIMLFIRLLLGLFSLFTVYYGYKIVERIAGKKSAFMTGMLLAVYWFMPFFSVRNLVEVIAIPFFAIGYWFLINAGESKKQYWQFLLTGLIMGIGVSVRFQSVILVAGIGLALIFRKKYLQSLIFGFGALLTFIIIQGGIDFFVWGKPFTEFMEYFRYNLASKAAYGTDNPWMYIELLLGFLLPPLSLFLLVGFFKVWRKHLEFFLPVFLFIAFHTFFSNRQERFILPIIPFYTMLGVIGWNEIIINSRFWNKRPKLLRSSYTFFWIINIALLIPVSFSSSKKSRIDAMYYFFDKKDQVNTILVDNTGRHENMMLPVFYSGKTINTITLMDENPNDTSNYDSLNVYSYIRPAQSMKIFSGKNGIDMPQFVIFVVDKDLEKRVEHMKQYFPLLNLFL